LVLNHQVPGYRIYVVAMGNAPMAAEGGTTAKHTSGGRVEISLLKNALLSSAQQECHSNERASPVQALSFVPLATALLRENF
jgi:hypothetical protein